jgi:hypothetical protein
MSNRLGSSIPILYVSSHQAPLKKAGRELHSDDGRVRADIDFVASAHVVAVHGA